MFYHEMWLCLNTRNTKNLYQKLSYTSKAVHFLDRRAGVLGPEAELRLTSPAVFSGGIRGAWEPAYLKLARGRKTGRQLAIMECNRRVTMSRRERANMMVRQELNIER